jgi:hypothetical protein
MAGAHSVTEIAAKLRRSPAAVAVEASKLEISLRTRPRHFGGPSTGGTRFQEPSQKARNSEGVPGSESE